MTSAPEYDLAVVGAGVAGSVLAREVARRGRRVLLVDKARFPRDKVCGCCLGLRGERLLLGAGFDLPDGPPLESLELRAGSRNARLPLPGGRVLSRAGLDTALLDAARDTGVDVRTGTPARLGPVHDSARVLLVGDEPVRAGLVTAADGLGGGLLPAGPVAAASRIGLGAHLPVDDWSPAPGRVEMLCGPGGYLGLARDERGRLDAAAAVDPRTLRAHGPAGCVARIVASTGRAPLPDAPWHGTPALTRGASRALERALPVGDAAGYVEPFTGEGMTWAAASALALAPLAAAGWSDELPRHWARVRRRAAPARSCRLLAPLLGRPRLVGGLVWLLARMPALGARWAQGVHRP